MCFKHERLNVKCTHMHIYSCAYWKGAIGHRGTWIVTILSICHSWILPQLSFPRVYQNAFKAFSLQCALCRWSTTATYLRVMKLESVLCAVTCVLKMDGSVLNDSRKGQDGLIDYFVGCRMCCTFVLLAHYAHWMQCRWKWDEKEIRFVWTMTIHKILYSTGLQ